MAQKIVQPKVLASQNPDTYDDLIIKQSVIATQTIAKSTADGGGYSGFIQDDNILYIDKKYASNVPVQKRIIEQTTIGVEGATLSIKPYLPENGDLLRIYYVIDQPIRAGVVDHVTRVFEMPVNIESGTSKQYSLITDFSFADPSSTTDKTIRYCTCNIELNVANQTISFGPFKINNSAEESWTLIKLEAVKEY